jgi:4-amino-4-deoxy-L-arabinose transferase-like glycosyltransferase
VILLLAFWLGARSLDSDAIWLDEYFSIYDSGSGPYGPLTPAQIWNRVAERNPWHAPGFFIVLSGWGRLVGDEPAALRTFSLFMGVLAVAATYQLGQTLVSRRVGVYGAALLSTSAFFIYYEHEIRMYTLIAFITVMTLLVYFRLLRARGRPGFGLWLAWVGCIVAVLYIHYLAAVPLVALGLYHLLFAPKNRRWWQMTGGGVLAGLAFLPWAQNLLSGLGLAAEAEALHNRALSTRRLLEMVGNLFGNGVLWVPLVFGALALTNRRRGALTLGFMAVVPLVLFVVFNRLAEIIPETRIRYLLSLWPLFALVVAVGLAQMRRWWRPLPLAGLAVWAALGLYSVSTPDFVSMLASAHYIFPLHQIDDVMREESRPGDAVAYVLSDTMAKITYERQADFYTSWRGLQAVFVEPRPTDPERVAMRDAALAALNGHERVWVASMPSDAPTALSAFEAALAVHWSICGTVVATDDLRLDLYAAEAEACTL